MVKALGDAVDQLLDRKQGNQHAGERNRGIERGDRRARGKAETAETPEIVDVAKPDQAERYAENHDADDDLDNQARRAVHRLGDRGQVQMIVAAGGYPGGPEKRTQEKPTGGLLQPQTPMSEGGRDHGKRYRPRQSA